MIKKYLEIGQIVGTHGIKGEVKVNPWADSGEFLLGFKKMYLDEGRQSLDIVSSRVHKNIVIIKIKGIDKIEQAETLRSKILFIDRADAKLPEGRYFISDLIGLRIVDNESGEEYGFLDDVSSAHSNEIYHVKAPNGKIYLIPAIDDVIAGTNIEGGYIKINFMEGMFDDED